MAGEVAVLEAGDAARLGGAVEDAGVGGGEHRPDGRQQLGRVAEVPVSAKRRVASWVRRRRPGVVDDPPPDRGDAVQAGGAVAVDRRADLLGPAAFEQDDRVTGLPLLEGDGPGPHVEERVGADHGPAGLGQGTRDGSGGGWPGGRGPPPWAGRCSRW